jgi:hypothetical protein
MAFPRAFLGLQTLGQVPPVRNRFGVFIPPHDVGLKLFLPGADSAQGGAREAGREVRGNRESVTRDPSVAV